MTNNSLKSVVPNALTLSNLSCGLFAINALFEDDFKLAAILLIAALIFDFLDGFMARLLGVHSELGKQLDSLADMVTFGVLPGFLMFHLFELSMGVSEPVPAFLPFIAFLIPVFSALRLAKFNIDTRQSENFIGLPTPSNAIFLFSIGFLAYHGESQTVTDIILHPLFLTGITIVTSYLLVAELPLMSLKFKNFRFSDNRDRMILLTAIIVLLVVFRFRALVFIIPLYVILSLIFKPGKN